MNKNIKNFIKYNKQILNSDIKYRGYIAVADRQIASMSFLSSIYISAYSNKFRLEPVIITDQLQGPSVKIFKSFGFKHFLLGFSYKKILSFQILVVVKTVLYFFYSLFKIININFDNFIKNYKVANVVIGDLVYDQYIRYNLSFKKPKVDFNFLAILFKAIFRVYNIDSYINNYNFKLIFVTSEGNANNNSILLRVGVKKKIKCYLLTGYEYINVMHYKSSNIKLGAWNLKPLGISIKDLNKLKISENKLSKFLNSRFKGSLNTLRTGTVDLINANSNRSISKKDLFNKLKINESFDKIVLVSPHVFSDAPHGLGTNFIFRDHYDQFLKTLEFIKSLNFGRILWLIRPHPTSAHYNEQGIVKEIIKSLNIVNKNIHYCPKEIINTKDLIKICDNAITGRGTIGLEFACYGKMPLIAGASVYDGFDLALEPKNQNEYFNFIKKIHLIKKMDKTKITLARKILFYLETMYPNKINDNDNLNTKNKLSKIFEDNIMNKPKNDLFKPKIINNVRKFNFKDDALYKIY